MKQILFALLLLGLMPACSAAEYTEGTHYSEIPFSNAPDTGGKVEVREFFWYGCPHCYHLEPTLDAWAKRLPKNVIFEKTPAILPRELVHAKAYYAFESLGKVDAVHGMIFESIHIKGRRLSEPQSMAAFAAAQGIDKKAFQQAYDSFAVDNKVRQATLLATKYRIRSVPTIVVDGRYLTSPAMTGGNAGFMDVVDYLIDKAAKERKAGK